LPVISSEQLQPFVRDIFAAAGTPADNAERVAAALVKSNLVGHDSHGVIRVPQYINSIRQGRMDPAVRPEVESETACTARVTGNWGWGQVAAWEATQLAIAKARQCGLAAVALHSSNHVGRVGEYVEEIARNDMVGLITLNNHGAAMQVAPFGGRERRLSSNPIAFAAPTSGDPILVDMTSSVVAEGKVRVLRNQGKLAPDGWLIDAEGRPTNDPRVLYADPPGALLPVGGPLGHKGYGLSVLIDVMSGGLSGAGCSCPRHTRIWNALFIEAIRVDAFVTREEYLQQVDDLVASLKSCAPAEGFTEVLIPGEPERRTEAQRLAQGISIDDETWHQLVDVANELGVTVPQV
jgi:uncharacterized oxidoreductase